MSSLAGVALAQAIEPANDWQSADSAHFRVNYRAAWRVQAERVAQAAERAYPRITQALGWEPRGRTEILLINQYDVANGYATPLPYNVIGVYLTPPDEGELLDNSDWLDLLLTHELTHTVHLDKVRGAPDVLQSIFGRFPWFFPNLYQPTWAIEGLAVLNESDPARGRGRLRGPQFEAWLRAESAAGFLSLREINAGGRALPVSKSYLYGAYFYEYLARRYGGDATPKFVERYSGNPPFWPRLHSNPTAFTGKTMDVLWEEFLADLKLQVAQRAEPVTRSPQVAGELLIGPVFDVGSVASLPSGGVLAVVDNGLNHPKLVKLAADGTRTELADVHREARLSVAPNGNALLTQPDFCNDWRFLVYDLYRVQPDGALTQLTHCARLRRAVPAGEAIAAVQQGEGRTRLLLLDGEGRERSVLWEPPADVTLIDLAASPDGRQLSVISKRAGDWRVLAFDLSQPAAAPRLLFTHDAPIHGLTHGPAGLEFIAAREGSYNVWRLEGDAWVRLSNSHTGVVVQGGTQGDGSLPIVAIAAEGLELRRIAASTPLQRVPVARARESASAEPAGGTTAPLSEPQPYSPWRTLAPRSWFPLAAAGDGLFAAGATTFGSDALGWHVYAASLMVETTQGEPIGALQYLYRDQHLFTLSRELTARAWKPGSDDEVTSYDRENSAQWLSVFPWARIDRTIAAGVGAAIKDVDRVHPELVRGAPPRDERMLVGLLSYDSSGTNWWSEGSNRGQHAQLLFETYKPFARDGHDDYDGNVLRLDWRGYVPIGRSVLGLRYTEAYASGLTERFQLGGAIDPQLQIGVVLNNRDIMLRGYRGDEANLRGANARAASIEWRTTLADVDQHFMVPAVGLNRLSAAAFFDVGGAWDEGNGPQKYQRGVGLELLGDLKFLYATGLRLRLGVAHGLDEPKETRGYVGLGRAF